MIIIEKMDSVKILINEVENLKNQKEYKKAIKLIQDSLSKYNDDYRLYEELADIYVYQGQYQKAIRAIDFALSINEESATGNYLKGFILLSTNKHQASLRYLEKSNKLMINNAEVLRNLGWAYSLSGEKLKGVMVLKRALNLNPEDSLIKEDLAMALIGLGELKEGKKLLDTIGK